MEREFIEALQIIAGTYFKILKVNLTKDTFSYIKKDHNEFFQDFKETKKFSSVISQFASTGIVHPDDVGIFEAETNITFIRNYLKNNEENFRLKYRRKNKDEYRWVLLEMLKAEEYADDNQVTILYIKDIHDSYIKELENQREMEILCNRDMLTGLNNFYAYKKISLLFSQYEIKNSVGVIFADLNGLKIVNDMEGHSAGDRYISKFGDILKSIFGASYSYRISGDEFLVILTGVGKREFDSNRKHLIEEISKDEVPLASVGWSWKKNPSKLEDVVKEAEYLMYDEKHEFYKKHPEYKRSIVEENYKKDVAAVIRRLAFSFGTLGLVELKKDHYTMLKDDDIKGLFLPTGIYSTFYKRLFSNYIADSSKDTAEKLLSLQNLKEVLKTEESLSGVVQLINGKWLQINANKTASDKNGNPEKLVFFTSFVDRDREKRLNENKLLKDEYKIIETLSRDYMFVSMINSKTGKVRIFKNEGLPESVVNLCKEGSYSEATDLFAKTFILESDRRLFLEVANIEYLKNEFKKNDEVSFIYRAFSDDGKKNLKYCEATFVNFRQNDYELIYAVKDITNHVILDQMTLKSLSEIILKVDDAEYL